MAWGSKSFAKSYSKPATKKATTKSWGSSRSSSWGRPSTRSTTKSYTKQPSTTNVGTRPSVMPGQPGVPTGGTKIVNKASALTKPVVATGKAGLLGPAATVSRAVAGTKKAGPIIKTPAPTAVKSAWTKTAPSNVRPATHMNHPTESRTGSSSSGSGTRTSSGTGTTTRPTAVTPSVTPTAVTPTPAAPVKPPVKPPVTGNTNPTPGFTSLTGRNVTAGQFNRRRLGRGPLANESLTPEELRRIASQKVNNYG